MKTPISAFDGKKLFFVVSFVALLAAGCGKSATNSPAAQSNNSQSQQSQQSQANSQPTPAGKPSTISVPLPTTAYTSKSDNFSVNFPGVPTIKNSSLPAPGIGQISVTEYRQIFTVGQEHAYYSVGVYHYPATYKFPDTYLNSALKLYYTIVSLDFPDAIIASQQPGQFLGNDAMSAEVSIPTQLANGSTLNKSVSLIITVKGQNNYIISAYGMDEDNFNAFLDSFKFLK